MKIKLYDTTLRDGTQSEGISLSVNDKIKITKRLDEFGINYIEGGWPGSNPKDVEYFERVQSLELKNAKIAAFGSTRRKNSNVKDDPNIKALVDAQTPVVTVVGKSWDLHVRDVLETTPEENLLMIEESVAYLKSLGKEVVYDAEHFFDGYQANPKYALATVQAAERGGADVLVLCETNGGALPWDVQKTVEEIASQTNTDLGVHMHEDGGNGVSNALMGVRAGAIHVQGTINGYGERVGNASLCSIIPNLQLKMGYECVSEENLKSLLKLSHYVAEIANQPQNPYLPFVGKKAFAHKGGIHVAAILKNEDSYQHIDPTLVGNKRRTLVSELSGRGNIIDKAKEFGIEVTSEKARKVVEEIKSLEAQGFTFEGAGASAQMLMKRSEEDYKAPFELIDFMVVVEQRKGLGVFSEATVKVCVNNEVIHTAAEGNGPVNALNKALRKALLGTYPELSKIHLSDYKVRILDSESGTEAKVRVLIDTKNGDNSRWSTVGASTNIIEASWRALADSMEYALQKK